MARVKKLIVIDPDLDLEVRRAAKAQKISVSAFLSKGAIALLRNDKTLAA